MADLRSMTGYGRASRDVAGSGVVVEARSVNGRGLDVRVRLGWPDLAIEARLEALVRARVERGHVEVRVAWEGGASAAVRANLPLAEQVHHALDGLRAALGLPDAVTLALVAAQPGVLVSGADQDEDAWAKIEPVAAAALDALDRARAAEGEALGRDLDARVGRLRALAGEIARASAARPDEARSDLMARLHRLDPPAAVDPARLAQEVALLAQRLDTTEERVRFDAHLDAVAALLAGGGAAGRKLDFLLQEVQRELGTIGAKSQSAPVSRHVVDARAEVEKMREQAQNLE